MTKRKQFKRKVLQSNERASEVCLERCQREIKETAKEIPHNTKVERETEMLDDVRRRSKQWKRRQPEIPGLLKDGCFVSVRVK